MKRWLWFLRWDRWDWASMPLWMLVAASTVGVAFWRYVAMVVAAGGLSLIAFRQGLRRGSRLPAGLTMTVVCSDCEWRSPASSFADSREQLVRHVCAQRLLTTSPAGER